MTASHKPAIQAPTFAKGVRTPHSSASQKTANPRQDFMIAALNMSWQLAIVVLLPILGGFKLDKHLHSLPLWTVLGFALAMIGMALVVWRQVQLFSPKITQADIRAAKKLRDEEDDNE